MSSNPVVDPLFPQCPIRNVLSRIVDRWSLLVLMTLQQAGHAMRFRDLKRAIPDISEKMLTSTLRELEADDMVVRTVFAEVPPHVEYELTARGRSLLPLLNQLVDWSVANMSDILKSREKHFAKHQ